MLSNMLRTVIMALLGLLMVPYYINQFGMAVYGILPLATSITTYVLIASESLANSFSRYLVMAIQSGDDDKAISTYTSTIIGMTKTVLKIAPIALIIAFISPYIFQIGSANAMDVQVMFALILISSLIVSFGTCLNSVFYSKNVLYNLYYIRTAYLLIQIGLVIVFFIFFGSNLMLVGLAYLISSIIYLLWLWVASRFICPSLRISMDKYNPELLKEMSRLGFWTIVSSLGVLMFIQASLILVNLFLGVEMQSEFSIVANMISMVNTACLAISAAGEPLIYKYYSEGNMEMVWDTLRLFTKVVGLIMVFPIAYIFIFTPQIVIVWIGSEYDYIIMMSRIMVPANLAVCCAHILNCVFLVQSRMREVAIATCLFGVFNIVLACALLIIMGDPVGAGIAWSLSIVLLNALFIPVYTAKIMGADRLMFVKPMILCYAVMAILAGLGMLLNNYWTMPNSFPMIVLTVLLGFIVYFLLIFFLLLSRHEKGIVLSYFPQSIQKAVLRRVH